LKYYEDARGTAVAQSNPADHGRQKICPADQVPSVKSEAERLSQKTHKSIFKEEYPDTAKNATEKLSYDGVESKPLSRQQALDAMNNPEQYAKQAFKLELKTGASEGAKYGAVFGAGSSVISNGFDCYRNGKSVKEAAIEVAKDSAVSGIKGAVTGAGTAVAKQALLKVGQQNLAKGGAPGAIAASTLEAACAIGSDFKKCYDGELTTTEAMCNMPGHVASAATKGATAYAGAQLGASLGVVAGPIGVAAGGFVGGTVGYFAGDKAVQKAKETVGIIKQKIID
jgi:hypothetical protein